MHGGIEGKYEEVEWEEKEEQSPVRKKQQMLECQQSYLGSPSFDASAPIVNVVESTRSQVWITFANSVQQAQLTAQSHRAVWKQR